MMCCLAFQRAADSQVLWGVAGVLKLPHNQLHVRAVRVGGGFGGKVRLRAERAGCMHSSTCC